MPLVPRVQSRGCEAVVKFVRRVTEVERVGSSGMEMGEKRWSSNAAVTAYPLNPAPSSCASNVPMHPRRLLFPLRGDIVFHVTNKGCSSLGGAAGDACCERRLPKLKKEVLEEDFELLSKVALEEVVERVDGVEEEDEAEAGDGA